MVTAPQHSGVIIISTAASARARTLSHRKSAVTSHTIASSSHPRDHANATLIAALAITAIAAIPLAGAWFFQLVLDIRPCPLCLEQRYAYYLVVPLGALIALGATRDAPRAALVVGFAMIALATLWNAGLG